MVYSFNVNNTPLNGSQSAFLLKESIKSAGWSVIESSDGITPFTNLNGDIITGFNSGANGLANTKAWFRIKMPTNLDGYGREFIFQRGTNNTDWRIKYCQGSDSSGSNNQSFSVGAGTLITPSSASSNNQVTVFGGGTDASPSFSQLFPTDNTYRFNTAAGGLSDGYTFYSFAFPINGGNPTSCCIFDRMINGTFNSLDIDPFVMQFNYVGGGGAITYILKCWQKKGLTGQGFVDVAAADYFWNGTTTTNFGSNPFNNKDDILPAVYGRLVSLGLPAGYKGIGNMMKINGVGRVTGDTLSISSTRDRIIAGSFNFPWDGTIPLI